jgi:hypothetical protein
MPKQLSPIPADVAIVTREGLALLFFHLRWQELQDGINVVPAAGLLSYRGAAALGAALGTTTIFTTRVAGRYRISYYTRKTVADGVSSSLTATIGWLEGGVPLTEAGTVLNVDNTGQYDSKTRDVYADAGVNLTIATAYASNTPGNMRYSLDASVELLQ